MPPSLPRERLWIDGQPVELIDQGPLDPHAAPAALPAVLVHGLGRDVTDWLPSVPALARDRRIIAPDLPALRPTGELSPDLGAIGAQLAAVLAARGVARAHWVGNSLGGHVAIAAAVAHVASCAAVVLVNSVVPHTRLARAAVRVREIFSDDDPVIAALGPFAPARGAGRVWLPRGGHLPQRDAPELFVPALREVLAALD